MNIKKYISNPLTTIALLTCAILMPVAELLAQPGLPGDPSQAPIDGGLLWLIIGGGAYGIKKIRDRNRTTNK